MSKLYLPAEKLERIAQTMETLSTKGVSVAEDHSGEMNFSGCATGSCMAWA